MNCKNSDDFLRDAGDAGAGMEGCVRKCKWRFRRTAENSMDSEAYEFIDGEGRGFVLIAKAMLVLKHGRRTTQTQAATP
jgi:hypothetical protein